MKRRFFLGRAAATAAVAPVIAAGIKPVEEQLTVKAEPKAEPERAVPVHAAIDPGYGTVVWWGFSTAEPWLPGQYRTRQLDGKGSPLPGQEWPE